MSRRLVHSAFRFAVLAVALPAAARAFAQQDSFPELIWKVDPRVADARRVFASPVDPDTVYVATDEGLQRTTDGGRGWTPIANTSPERLGTVADLAVCPANPAFVVLGSREKGVFLSADGGLTWRAGGAAAEGLASLKVHAVFFSGEDRAWRTLLVLHGSDAPGISKSIDRGAHWRVLAPQRYFQSLAGRGQVLVASSAAVDEPQDWQMVRSVNYGESWSRVDPDAAGRNGSPTAGAVSLLPPWSLVWGESGHPRVTEDEGETWKEGKFVPEGRWLSVFATCGRTPPDTWFWVYDPFQNGLYAGKRFDVPWTPRNRGLYVNRMIRRGADMTADASATRFYACINGALYAGEHAAGAGPIIRSARAAPAVLDLSRQFDDAGAKAAVAQSSRRIVEGKPLDAEIRALAEKGRVVRDIAARRSFAVRVRVEHPRGPGAVRKVAVTPDLLGVEETSLYDDGLHDDGAAGDGTWGGSFQFAGERVWDAQRARDQGRLPFPGTRRVPLVVVDDAGERVPWTLPLTVFFSPEPLYLSYDPGRYQQPVRGEPRASGRAKAAVKAGLGPDGGRAFEVIAAKEPPGDWEATWFAGGGNGVDADITGLDYVIFSFKGSPGSGDVEFFIIDHLMAPVRGGRDAIEGATSSRAVPLVKGKYLPAMDGQYHTVKIPVYDLVRDMRFMRGHLAGFGIRPAGENGSRTPDAVKGPGPIFSTYTFGEARFANE